jgi:hypothetical protein
MATGMGIPELGSDVKKLQIAFFSIQHRLVDPPRSSGAVITPVFYYSL